MKNNVYFASIMFPFKDYLLFFFFFGLKNIICEKIN